MSININVSGGNAAFGAVSQGDKNNVTSSMTPTFGAVMESLAIEAVAQRRSTHDLSELLDQVDELRRALRENKESGAASVLKTIKEHHGWAVPVIKDFVSAAYPALVSLLT